MVVVESALVAGFPTATKKALTMPSIFTLEGAFGATREKKPTPEIGTCKVVFNGRTGRSAKLCYVGKKPGQKGSGWKFVKDGR